MSIVTRTLLAILVLAAVPGSAVAEPPVEVEHKWCVRGDGGAGSYVACQGPATCSGVFTTISDALAAARSAPDPDPLDPPAHMICIDTPGTHTESVTVDNADGQLGTYLGIQFTSVGGVNWCDDGAPRTAGFELVGSGDPEALVEILKLRTDSATCGRNRAVFNAMELDFTATRLVVLGGDSPVLTSSSSQPQEHWVGASRAILEGILGNVIDAGTTVFLDNAVFAGNSAVGEPLIHMTAASAPGGVNTTALELTGAVIAGNAVTGAPLVSSAEGLTIKGATFWGNAVAGGDLVSVGPSTPVFRAKSLVLESEFSRNVLLDGAASVSPSPPVHVPDDPDLGVAPPCGPAAMQGIPISSRLTASWVGQPGPASLLLFTSPGAPDTSLRLYRNYFVENELSADGAVLDAGVGHETTSVYLVHNLFGAHAGAVVRGGEGVAQCRLASIRNVYLGTPRMDLGACWGKLEVTSDFVQADSAGWDDQFPRPPVALVGPTWAGLPSEAFEQDPEDQGLGQCERHRLHCPSAPPGCPGGTGWCPMGEARHYLFSAAARAEVGRDYPWVNTMLDLDGSPSVGVPGPAGWDCSGDQPFPTDSFETKDADGFTDLVDCDNLDPQVVPVLPELHGVDMPWCQPDADSCYLCPEESCWPPGVGDCPELPDPGDDDDSGGADDDDDSGGADDDDSAPSPGEGESLEETTVPVGCASRGCGAALSPLGASMLVTTPLVGVRRRRRRWAFHPSAS